MPDAQRSPRAFKGPESTAPLPHDGNQSITAAISTSNLHSAGGFQACHAEALSWHDLLLWFQVGLPFSGKDYFLSQKIWQVINHHQSKTTVIKVWIAKRT